MKKVNALVIGIVFLFAALAPFTSAFADSDPGISGAAINAAFGWYTGFPLVDSAGYLDTNDWTITYRSNGTDSTSSAGSGDVVYLYQPGDYVEYHFSNWDLLSSYSTPVWNIHFGQNPSYGTNTAQAKYTLFQGYSESTAFYQFLRMYTYDSRDINWSNVFFTYPGTGITSIRIEYYGTPIIWNCIYIKFTGYRGSTDGYSAADLTQLQTSITNMLNIAQLADAIEMDSSDIDLSTLEATTVSILQKLANVPDIIQYIDNLESINTDIRNGISTFYNYYTTQQTITYINIPIRNFNFRTYNQGTYGTATDFSTLQENVFLTNDSWVIFRNSNNYSSVIGDFLIVQVPIGYYRTSIIPRYEVYYSYDNGGISLMDRMFRQCYVFYTNNDPVIYIPYVELAGYTELHIYVHILYDVIYSSNNQPWIAYNHTPYVHRVNYTERSILERIYIALHNFIFNDTQVPSGIQQTTDTVTEQVTDIVEFEDTYNTSLENSASQIDVSSYEIQQTQGMSFMRTYTELNFDRMQNFRIIFLTPLILALAAFFLRRKT